MFGGLRFAFAILCAFFAAQFCKAAQVYLWRQSYDEDTGKSLEIAARHFEAVNFLQAKISFGGGNKPRLALISINADYLRGLKVKKIACIRISGLSASEKEYAALAPKISKIVRFCAFKAAESIGIDEIQIDFDCPESKLGFYALWLEEIRAVLPKNLFLSITAVPSQMNAKNFEKALKYCDYFTLQIHNIANYGGGLEIFDFENALSEIRRADKFGKKFMVALPTYSHFVEIGENGKLSKVLSENFAGVSERASLRTKKISSNPLEVEKLSLSIKELELKNFCGEIYFRLPCGNEISNWSLETLLSLAKREKLKLSHRVFTAEAGNVCDVFLENTGNVDLCAPFEAFCKIENAKYCEGVGGFVFNGRTDGGVILKNGDDLTFKLKPNKKIKIGWIKK